jgi:hypothetical protein
VIASDNNSAQRLRCARVRVGAIRDAVQCEVGVQVWAALRIPLLPNQQFQRTRIQITSVRVELAR